MSLATKPKPLLHRLSIRRAIEASTSISNDIAIEDHMSYDQFIASTKRRFSKPDAFPQEWGFQLLVDGGESSNGYKIMLFCPAFLLPLVSEGSIELDRALKYIFMRMDEVGMNEDYIFVYCHSGMNWVDSELADRLKFAYNTLPGNYVKGLQRFIVMHPTTGLRLMMGSVWPFLSPHSWEKLEYCSSMGDLAESLHPDDKSAQRDLLRHFPQIVHCEDALWHNQPPRLSFGMTLQRQCDVFGVSYLSRATQHSYPSLPPTLVVLCEALERQSCGHDFPDPFATYASAIYELVAVVDRGLPLQLDVPVAALWCVLKLFLDCLPTPVLGSGAFAELESRKIGITDQTAQRKFLDETLKGLPRPDAHVALFLATYFHSICSHTKKRFSTDDEADEGLRAPNPKVNFAVLAEFFAPTFFRPQCVAVKGLHVIPVAVATMETFIKAVEDPSLFSGHVQVPRPTGRSERSELWSPTKSQGPGSSSDSDTE